MTDPLNHITQTHFAASYGWEKSTAAQTEVDVSVVVPMYNEEENAPVLVAEIHASLAQAVAENSGIDNFEIICVNDCSKDTTLETLLGLREKFPELRVLSHGQNGGQSRAVRTGILGAKGLIIATLDGDGQNNPIDIPKMVYQLKRDDAPDLLAMVAGERQKRQDSQAKLWASKWANNIRKSVLNDNANDTGCGLKVFYRSAFLALPYFDHIHRYLPALMTREGLDVEFAPISHRPRQFGESKYNNLNRALVAIRDMLGVIWLQSRAKHPVEIIEFKEENGD